jgi:hypothetical protein
MLGLLFTIGIIVVGLFGAWTYTKKGKNWLRNL